MERNVMLLLVAIVIISIVVPFTVLGENQHKLKVSGASTIQPIIEEISELYADRLGLEVVVEAGGSTVGVEDAISKKSDLGMVSRELKEVESSELEQVLIALDTIVFIVNQENPIMEISKEKIVDIYTRNVKSLDAFGWSDQPIILVSKEMGRSTLDLFEGYSELKSHLRNEAGPTISEDAIVVGANIESTTLVGGIPNAIGYVSLGTAINLQNEGMPFKILSLDQVEPTEENVVNGKYPILRELNVVYKKENETKVTSLLEILLSQEGQEIIKDHSFIQIK